MILPPPPALEKLCRSIAILDAILSPEWEHRYFSFNQHWAPGQRMASMRNGSGDDWHLVFRDSLAFLKAETRGHRRLQSVAKVPQIFQEELNEPAFSMEHATFYALWLDGDWSFSGTPSPYFGVLDGKPGTYRDWAEDYFETEVPLTSVEAIYRQEPVTLELVKSLNANLDLVALEEDLLEIGYPSSH